MYLKKVAALLGEIGGTQTPGHFFCVTLPPEILRFLADMLKMLTL